MQSCRFGVLLSCTVLLMAACGEQQPASDKQAGGKPAAASSSSGGRDSRPSTVSTVMTRTETVPVVLEAQGTILALDEVELRAQKTGVIAGIHFAEGAALRKGQLLFTLDDRDDQANVRRNQANVASAQATLDAAKRDFARSQDLSAKNFVSPSALDVAKNKLETAEAGLAQSQAALEQARVLLSYTQIRAPQDGRAGRVDVRPGALVTSGATSPALVKITRLDPIGASFVLPERELPALLAAQAKDGAQVKVDLGNDQVLRGKVIFIDSAVDRTSGTISVKARLNNPKHQVWPGQFVTVRIAVGEIENAVVLPAQAVISGPNGRLVYRVLDDSSVEPQNVELLRVVDEKAVLRGIDAGVKVVLEGAQNLRPGGKIKEAPSEEKGGKRGRRGGQDGAQDKGAAAAPASSAQAQTASGNQAAQTGAAAQPAAAATAQRVMAASTVVLPEGFTPRDPEAWAGYSDEEKRTRIERWRARRAEGQGASGQ